MWTRRDFSKVLGAAAGLTALAQTPLRAQPAERIKLLTIVVPFPAGGATDGAARIIGESLRGSYADVVVIDNRAGASGQIGVEYLKGRPADGSFLLYTPAFPLSIFPHIYKQLRYDSLKDFVPVASASRGMHGLAIGPAVPQSVKTVQEFVAWCKANPTRASFGAPSGSSQHFAGVMFARAAGIQLPLIPYKGGAPAVVDLLGGHIPATVSPLPEILPHAVDGKLRIVAVTGASRTHFLPQVPTMVESGYQDVVFQDWSGFLAPAQTPAATVARLNALISAYVRSEKGTEALAKLGTEADAQGVAEFAATVKANWERYSSVVKSTGFKAEE